MRRWLALALLLAAAPLVAPGDAHALRCGTDLIDVGDTRAEVRAKCGEPLDVARRVVTQTIRQRVAAGAAGVCVGNFARCQLATAFVHVGRWLGRGVDACWHQCGPCSRRFKSRAFLVNLFPSQPPSRP